MMRAPATLQHDREQLSLTLGMRAREPHHVRGHTGTAAAFDTQRNLAKGALVNAMRAAKRLGRDLDLTELTQSALAGWFWARYGRECYRVYTQHDAHAVLSLKYPSLGALLWFFATEP